MVFRQPQGKVRSVRVSLKAYDKGLVEQLTVVLREFPEVDLEKSRTFNRPKGVEPPREPIRATFIIVFVEEVEPEPFLEMLHERLPDIFATRR